MATLPAFDPRTRINSSPHVVILGAGASKAALPHGDATGMSVPLMAELIECVGLGPVLDKAGIEQDRSDFEALYDSLASSGKYPGLVADIESRIYNYFKNMRLPESPTIYDYLVLSLRDKDLIATFNWDPLLPQAFRRNRHVATLPRLAFLHGNVEVGACIRDRAAGWMY